MKIRKIYFLALSLLTMMSACKDDKSEYDKSGYTDALVKSFALSDISSMDIDLSEVFFTIDQYGVLDSEGNLVGQIYNADSLPIGTPANKLLASISFNDPSKVTLFTATDTLEYSSSDSIDFSSPVKMEVIAGNGINKKYYTIKVNVHQMVGDSIDWITYVKNPLANTGSIENQRAVSFANKMNWYVENSNSNVLLYTSTLDGLKQWTPQTVTLPMDCRPDLSSLRVFGESIYMVDDLGRLIGSNDGLVWDVISTEHEFINLIGTIDGVNGASARYIALVKDHHHKYHYSTSTDAVNWALDGEMKSDFPISGYTNSIQYFGGTTQRIVIVGGKTKDGVLTNDVWAWDGGKNDWTTIRSVNSELKNGLQGASLFEYQYDPRYPNTFWMLIGGETTDGYSSDIYYSPNKGISWEKVPSTIAFPSAITGRAFMSPYVASDLYIYLIGGKDKTGELNEVLRGRLNQLTFKPLE